MKSLDPLRFDSAGLIPVVIQHAETLEVITLAYMNREAIEKSIETGKIHVYRRSHGRLMMKGETSGMTQDVAEVRVDCADNSVLMKVVPRGPGCHEGYPSCFFRRLRVDADEWEIADERGFDPAQVYGSAARPT